MTLSNRLPKNVPRFTWLAIFGLLGSTQAASIPERPEKLSFPPLTYEPPDPAQFRVALQSGPTAYIVPDRELPLVSISILIRTGNYLDPAGKEGLAQFTGHLLARAGTEARTAEVMDERLAFLAANLSSSVGDTQGSVSLNLLSKDLQEGLAILREVLTTPRFQADRLELHRQQTLAGMKQRNDDSSDIEQREREMLAYGEQFWACRYDTEASVNAIQPEDLRTFHRRWFHPANFVVAASGDFDRADMVARLESLFANWPFPGEPSPRIPDDTRMAAPGLYLVDKDVNQGRVSILLPGVQRGDPDYPAIQIMNDILGGGGFTSRIMNRVRSDEGLAYGAGSSFPEGVYYPSVFAAGFASKSRTVAQAAGIVLEEIKAIAERPVDEGELITAKRSFIDTFPQTFATRSRTAAVFAADEFTGRYARQPDYWKTWRSRLDGVTRADIQRVARERLHPDKAVILVVGQAEEILKGHPDHPADLKSLAGGRVTRVPLRDPLTMKPMDKKNPGVQ